MSHKTDSETLLRALAREGGRLKFSRLSYDAILAASPLARAGRVWTGKQAERWDLVLAGQEPGS